MTKCLRFILCATLCLVVPQGVFAGGEDNNLLVNPGFESVTGAGQIVNWEVPSYWSGQLTAVGESSNVHSGSHSALLRAASKNGKDWGRIFDGTVPVTLGLHYRFKVWAKGSGTLKLGAVNYRPQLPGKPPYEYQWQTTSTSLSEQWREVTFEFAPLDLDVSRLAPVIEVDGQGAAAFLDDADFRVARRPGSELTLSPAYVMLRPGDAIDFAIKALDEGKPLAGGALTVVTKAADKLSTGKSAIGPDGAATFHYTAPPDAPVDQPVPIAVTFVQPDLGDAATAYIDIVRPEAYAAFAAAAAKAKLASPTEAEAPTQGRAARAALGRRHPRPDRRAGHRGERRRGASPDALPAQGLRRQGARRRGRQGSTGRTAARTDPVALQRRGLGRAWPAANAVSRLANSLMYRDL